MTKSYSYREVTKLIQELINESEKYSSLSDTQLLTKPDPTSWCVGEIFEQKKLDLNKIKVRNKVFFIKMSLIEYILMFEAHQSRHLWQAEQTLRKIKSVTE